VTIATIATERVEEACLRLSPVSSSRRVLALEFIRRYFRDYGSSPSFGEIGAALNIPTQRVGALIRPLVESGELIHRPGIARSFKLPDRAEQLSDAEIAVILLRRGWIVNGHDIQTVAESVMKSELEG
jgi:hypothetical protein